MIKDGQKFRSLEDLEVGCMTSWKAPYIGGGDVVLPAGEEFIINGDPIEGATAVYCEAVNYDKLHPAFVSEEDRNNPRYSSYYLCIDLELIETKCELVPDK